MDGPNERRLTLGLLTPHAAAGAEVEIPDLSQGRVAVKVARIRSPKNAAGTDLAGPPNAQALRDLARPEVVERAAACFANGSVDVVAYASTTTGYALGARSEAALLERLTASCAVPVVGSAGAAADALRARGADRLVLIHPPWFDDEIDQLGVGYFSDHGFDVTLLKPAGLPRDPSAVRAERRHRLDHSRPR